MEQSAFGVLLNYAQPRKTGVEVKFMFSAGCPVPFHGGPLGLLRALDVAEVRLAPTLDHRKPGA